MQRLSFHAPEYCSDGHFQISSYDWEGDERSGWKLLRNGTPDLNLGAGFTPVKTIHCGICSTDLARRFLPYPLPQIIGHEVVGSLNGKRVVVEINASHHARGLKTDCPFCNHGMPSQCPERITLGIDRLPGGFAPWFLAPVHAILEIPDSITPRAAALTEPFAAALHAVRFADPRPGDRIAVLGPRRLGMLILSALAGHRKERGIHYTIEAAIRHQELHDISLRAGADLCVHTGEASPESLRGQYDIVFDTTGKSDGFEAALGMTRRTLHLKSTSGQPSAGISRLTDMVVDEISLLPLRPEHLRFRWPGEAQERTNPSVYVSPSVSSGLLQRLVENHPDHNFHSMDLTLATEKITGRTTADLLKGSPFPRFDLAITSDPREIDSILRPLEGKEFSIVRPRGAILLADEGRHAPVDTGSGENPFAALEEALLDRGIAVQSSRCGDFGEALRMMEENPWMVSFFDREMVSAVRPLSEIEEAFQEAADSTRSIKVLVSA